MRWKKAHHNKQKQASAPGLRRRVAKFEAKLRARTDSIKAVGATLKREVSYREVNETPFVVAATLFDGDLLDGYKTGERLAEQLGAKENFGQFVQFIMSGGGGGKTAATIQMAKLMTDSPRFSARIISTNRARLDEFEKDATPYNEFIDVARYSRSRIIIVDASIPVRRRNNEPTK